MGNKIAQFKKGQIKLTAFDNGGNISFSLQKVYFDSGSGEWKSTLNFFLHELEAIQILCRDAQLWIGIEPDKIAIFDVVDAESLKDRSKEN